MDGAELCISILYCILSYDIIVFLTPGEMAIPHYTGKMTDWIMNEDEPEAFSHAITIMSVITIMRWEKTLLSLLAKTLTLTHFS